MNIPPPELPLHPTTNLLTFLGVGLNRYTENIEAFSLPASYFTTIRPSLQTVSPLSLFFIYHNKLKSSDSIPDMRSRQRSPSAATVQRMNQRQ